jgi:hypothetical protein
MTETAVSVIESKWGEFSNAVANRETCDISCPVFASCPMTIYSPECLVSVMSDMDKRKMLTIFFMGEDGIKTEILNSLFRLSQKLDMKDVNDLRIYLDNLLRVHRQLFNQKNKTQQPMSAVQIIMGDVAPRREESRPMVVLEERDITKDPESLFQSPELDNIIGAKNGNSRS